MLIQGLHFDELNESSALFDAKNGGSFITDISVPVISTMN